VTARPRALAAAVLLTLLALAGVASAQTDPLLGQQWHLLPRTVEPAGADVRDVWPTTKGAGVVIGIIDDGVQTTHPDLQPNLVLTLSRDFYADPDDADPNPQITGPCNAALIGSILGDGCRGTAAAGLAAARDNTLGGSGVAPRAGLAALRLLGPDSGDFFSLGDSDTRLAAAIAFRNDAIHVKSVSWGPPDDGAGVVSMEFETATALAAAVQSGRGGRGTVFVWAAGNGGDLDNCNFDGFASSRYTLAVGAVATTRSAPRTASGARRSSSSRPRAAAAAASPRPTWSACPATTRPTAASPIGSAAPPPRRRW
jgi:subtilisin family serine protease